MLWYSYGYLLLSVSHCTWNDVSRSIEIHNAAVSRPYYSLWSKRRYRSILLLILLSFLCILTTIFRSAITWWRSSRRRGVLIISDIMFVTKSSCRLFYNILGFSLHTDCFVFRRNHYCLFSITCLSIASNNKHNGCLQFICKY